MRITLLVTVDVEDAERVAEDLGLPQEHAEAVAADDLKQGLADEVQSTLEWLGGIKEVRVDHKLVARLQRDVREMDAAGMKVGRVVSASAAKLVQWTRMEED
jgi:hypothetical protein